MAEELKASPCPFCGDTPGDNSHTMTDGGFKYGAIQCGCGAIGPDVRTEYKDWPHWKDAAIREWNTRAQLPSQGGEAVEVVAHLVLGGMFHGGSGPELGDIGYQIEVGVAERLQLENVKTSQDVQLELMTVAQHQRILAASTHPADQVADDLTMVKVSRELLERIAGALLSGPILDGVTLKAIMHQQDKLRDEIRAHL